MTLPEILECAHVGPEDRLILRVTGEWSNDQIEEAMEMVRAVGLLGRVLIVVNIEEMTVVDA